MSFKGKQQKTEKILIIGVISSLILFIGMTSFFLVKIFYIVNQASSFEKPKESNLHFKLLEAEKILFQEK
ncbi:MAG: hypothetical protein AB7D02_00580 [Candidatus Paceibacterota bacterium]